MLLLRNAHHLKSGKQAKHYWIGYQPDYNDVYTHIVSVFTGTKEDVDDMESYLINKYISHPKCDNKKDGDASNNDTMSEDAEGYHVYVVWR